MSRRALYVLVLLTAFIQWGCAEMQSMGGADSLIKLLTSQLGVTSNQAAGGVGSKVLRQRVLWGEEHFPMLTAE